MNKTFVKLLTLAPVMLVALTACESKLSADKAKERAKGYDTAAVAEKYASYDVETKFDVKKRTGVFAEGGLFSLAVETVISAMNRNSKGNEPATGVMSESSIKDGETEGVTVTYYTYKKSGLKIVTVTDMNKSESGANIITKGKSTTYVLDDGRSEKGNGNIKMSLGASSSGITLEGEFEAEYSIKYIWNAAA